jgi:mono/diheme cytochrome c family protein
MKTGILVVAVALAAVAAQPKVDFQKDIEPILTKNCVLCHQATWAGGGLRLDSIEGVQHGGTTGKAVVPGNPQQSLLLERMQGSDTKCMPPKGRISEEQIALVKTWITQGAKMLAPPSK